MKGGYLEDRFLHGSKAENCYYFIHWSLVDTFVYFSHHLVTIPPCGWISAAHRNGVKILGTFITEWEQGAKVCEDILGEKRSVHDVCLQLVTIANYHNFDGWLINIENKLNINQIPLLEEFVNVLTTKMHESQPDSLVIWYDSVIENGDLKWQNALTEYNRNFFLSCDGIFLNYNWTEELLKKSVSEAGSRKTDVYVGVDVFGRGCLGGGGFSCDIAVTVARKLGLSVAIFAPGWVYECLDVKNFKENQYKFWDCLKELCFPRTIAELPYYSTFCPGFGKKMFRNGKVIGKEPWFNISIQQPQPTYHLSYCSKQGAVISTYDEDAYSGGGCLSLSAKFNTNGNPIDFKILSTHFVLVDTCVISYTFKLLQRSTKVALVLSMQSDKGSYKLHLLDDTAEEISSENSSLKVILPAPENELMNTSYRGNTKLQSHYWIKRTYMLKSDSFHNHTIKEVDMHVDCKNPLDDALSVSVLLGELEILPVFEKLKFTYKDFAVRLTSTQMSVQCLLEWSSHPSIFCFDLYFVSNNSNRYIGTTSQSYWNFKQSMTPTSKLEFVLHPQTAGNESFHSVSLKIPLKV